MRGITKLVMFLLPKLKKLPYLFLSLLMFSATAFSQNNKITLSGIIKDSTSEVAIPYVNSL
jgi:hypothetical protein